MRLAITGSSHWHTPLHLDAFRECGAQIVAIHDAEPVSARRVAAPLGVPVASDWSALLDFAPDLVLCLGTPQQLLDAAHWFTKRNVPIAIEKPVGTSAPELHALVLRPGGTRSFVNVAQPHLWGDFWHYLNPQRYGSISHFRFRLVNGSPARYPAAGVPWVLEPLIAGGGVLRNLGIHGASAFLQLTGQRVEVQSCLLSSVLHRLSGEEYASVQLTSGGVIGQIEVGYTLAADAYSEFEMTAHLEMLSVRDDGSTLTIIDRRTGERTERPCLPLARRYEQFARVTLDALNGGPGRVHSLGDHLAAMDVLDRAYACARWVSA